MQKKNLVIVVIIIIAAITLALLSPKTSYVKADRKELTASEKLVWDFRFYEDLSSVTFYKDIWTGGECVLSEKITTVTTPEKGTVTVENELVKTKEKEGATTITYDMTVIVEEKISPLVYQYIQAWQELQHQGAFVASLTTFLGADTEKRIFLETNKDYVLYLMVVNTTDGFSSAPTADYGKWEKIFMEDRESSFIVIRMET